MKIRRTKTETYYITGLEKLDPVTVIVQNHKPGQGEIIIKCYNDSWTHYWGAMGENTVEEFFIGCDDDYLINKLIKSNQFETDWDKIEKNAREKGIKEIHYGNPFTERTEEMERMFRTLYGEDWTTELPQKISREYTYLEEIVFAVKEAFKRELKKNKS